MYIQRTPWLYFLYGNYTYIRLFIFLFTGVFVGFPALLWALRVLYRHHKTERQISFISIFLLLSDLLELIIQLSPVLVSFVNNGREALVYNVAGNLLFGARICGHLLHQLVALEYFLILKYPSLAGIFSPPCSTTFSTIVCLITIGCQFTEESISNEINICLCVLPVMLCAFTCFLTCKAPSDTNQSINRLVLSVAIFTLLILYVPFFLSLPFYFILPFELYNLASMRLIAEPILCVLVCRKKHLAQTR